MRDSVSLGPFVAGSLSLHALVLTAAMLLAGASRVPPAARVLEVTVLTPKERPASVKPETPKPTPPSRPERRAASKKPAGTALNRPQPPHEPTTMHTTPRAAAPRPVVRRTPEGERPGLRSPGPERPASPRPVRMARRELADPGFQGYMARPAASGSGTPAGPGRNPLDEAPGGRRGGRTRLAHARPGISFPGEQLSENPRLPGGVGNAAPDPLPRGVAIGRRNAAVESDPSLVSRRAGGGSPAPGAGRDAGGGPRAPGAPETVSFRGGAGGMRLPKAAPRLGGGGGSDYVIATGPSSRDADEVPEPRPGVGPGIGGGAGAGAGGGMGFSRGRGIGLDAGEHDLATLQRRPGAGIGAASGAGVGGSRSGSGREGSGEMPGTGGGRGYGYGSGRGIGSGPGRGGAKARPGVPGLPYGDPGGAVAGGNPAGGGGKGGGPGGPGAGIQVARRGGGSEGTGAGGSGESGEGVWSGSGRGRGAGGRGIGPGTGTGTGAGPGTNPGSGSGGRGRGNDLPGVTGGGGGGGGRSRIGKAVPGLREWDEEIIGRGFYPDGIVGEYYDDPDQKVDHTHPETYLNKAIAKGSSFTRLVARRKDRRIDFNWNPRGEWGDWSKLDSPIAGVNSIYWSARWTGQVFVPKDDVYTFKFDPLDDGGRLYLRYKAGGPMVKVIDAWRISATRPETHPYFMKRGAYDIRIEYAQGPEFYAAITLKWKSSSFDWEVIGPYQSGGVRRVRR